MPMVPEINYLAVIVATLSTIVIGTVWYSPKTFGPLWTRLAKVPQTGTAKTAIPAMIASLIASFITAWVLAGATYISLQFYGGSLLGNAIVTSLTLYAGLTAARFIAHDAFERRSPILTVLTVTYELVTVLVMALIIGLWPPA